MKCQHIISVDKEREILTKYPAAELLTHVNLSFLKVSFICQLVSLMQHVCEITRVSKTKA